MTSYNATLEFAGRASDNTAAGLVDELADYHPAIGRGLTGQLEVTITIQAETLKQAIGTALAVVQVVGHEPASIRVLTTEEFDRRLDLPPVPELLSVTEAAVALGITRQAIQQRIDAGTLPAQRVGNSWAVLRSAVEGAKTAVPETAIDIIKRTRAGARKS